MYLQVKKDILYGEDMKTEYIDEREIDRIVLLYELASNKDRNLSIERLASLIPFFSEPELLSLLSSSDALKSRYAIHHGQIIRRFPEDNISKKRAIINLKIAESFLRYCYSVNAKVLAVSGSNSYLSASADDDIDIFCITERNTLWPFIARALIFARLYRLIKRSYPQITVSCAMDSEYAINQFIKPKDLLFARDALSTKVMKGHGYYRRLLERSAWIKKMYPVEYKNKVEELGHYPIADIGRMSLLSYILNRLFYILVGGYIRLKSYILNRRLAKEKRYTSIFRLKIGYDHLIYESSFYVVLRRLYSLIKDENRS